MKNYVKLYRDYFGYGIDDFIACALCGDKAVDIHHIDCRGMGGAEDKDTIENLMALCRKCHIVYGDIKNQVQFLKHIHLKKIRSK